MTWGSLVPGARVGEPAETHSNRERRPTDGVSREMKWAPLKRPGRGVPPPRSGPPPLGMP
jgi:hypothetical protein